MNKDNIFRSSNFFMSEGDILHMIIIDEAGVPLTVDLQTTPVPGEVINIAPGQAVVKVATAITGSSFTANWNLMENATGYYLDVATDSAFISLVAGFSSHDAGNATSHAITGLDPNYTYYYRVRAYNDIGTGIDSEIIIIITSRLIASDYFLPSKDGLSAMRTELYLYGIGGFNVLGAAYWSSTEVFGSVANAWVQAFSDGSQGTNTKTTSVCHVRACRAFTSINNYNLRDIGPSGGWIFWKSGNNYLEAALSDCVDSIWSNILTGIGATAQGTAIGTGQANTTAIISQVGHTASAAKLCDDLIL